MRASKQAKDKTGRYKACSVLLLGMSRDRRIALCIPYTYTCWFYTLNFASLGDKVTVIANGRARIFLFVSMWYILVPLSAPSAAVQGRAAKKVVLS